MPKLTLRIIRYRQTDPNYSIVYMSITRVAGENVAMQECLSDSLHRNDLNVHLNPHFRESRVSLHRTSYNFLNNKNKVITEGLWTK